MANEIVNKVQQSSLITIELNEFLKDYKIMMFDIKDQLHEGLVLKEKDFRKFIVEHDWSKYTGKTLGVYCSTEAIIPMWAYMLIASAAEPFVNQTLFGNNEQVKIELINQSINSLNEKNYKNERVIIKGCSTIQLPEQTYINITQKLQPVVKSLMFGEACSTVPVYKRK
jgi:hypothetical protein